jgi:alcohol dehydrogenase (NADP+)
MPHCDPFEGATFVAYPSLYEENLFKENAAMRVYGLGTKGPEKDLVPVSFERLEPRPGEVHLKVTHCGVCHSDLHQARNDWGNTQYPCVPGHEIVGLVISVGDGVKAYKKGDRVGVGCMINSCQRCEPCENNLEQFCEGPKSCTLTYNGPKKPDGTNSYGGYSTEMVVREEFLLSVPDAMDPANAGPIMCAGITMYSPMVHWNLRKGDTLGVAGIGGLGHMGIQIGKALGAKVVAFTRSESKRDEIRKMGADRVVVSTDDEQMKDAAQSLDLLINTIPVPHDLNPYISLMKPNSNLVVVGNMIKFPEFAPGPLVFNRISVAGSLIGGIKETQEVLDLCAKHDIKPHVKMISADDINEVFQALKNGNDGDFRHVIDMDSLRNHQSVQDKSAEKIDDPVRGDVVGVKVAH